MEPIKLNNVLKREGYDSLLDTLERNNATEFVEKLIENIAENFHINISDLLGHPKQKEQEEPRELPESEERKKSHTLKKT